MKNFDKITSKDIELLTSSYSNKKANIEKSVIEKINNIISITRTLYFQLKLEEELLDDIFDIFRNGMTVKILPFSQGYVHYQLGISNDSIHKEIIKSTISEIRSICFDPIPTETDTPIEEDILIKSDLENLFYTLSLVDSMPISFLSMSINEIIQYLKPFIEKSYKKKVDIYTDKLESFDSIVDYYNQYYKKEDSTTESTAEKKEKTAEEVYKEWVNKQKLFDLNQLDKKEIAKLLQDDFCNHFNIPEYIIKDDSKFTAQQTETLNKFETIWQEVYPNKNGDVFPNQTVSSSQDTKQKDASTHNCILNLPEMIYEYYNKSNKKWSLFPKSIVGGTKFDSSNEKPIEEPPKTTLRFNCKSLKWETTSYFYNYNQHKWQKYDRIAFNNNLEEESKLLNSFYPNSFCFPDLYYDYEEKQKPVSKLKKPVYNYSVSCSIFYNPISETWETERLEYNGIVQEWIKMPFPYTPVNSSINFGDNSINFGYSSEISKVISKFNINGIKFVPPKVSVGLDLASNESKDSSSPQFFYNEIPNWNYVEITETNQIYAYYWVDKNGGGWNSFLNTDTNKHAEPPECDCPNFDIRYNKLYGEWENIKYFYHPILKYWQKFDLLVKDTQPPNNADDMPYGIQANNPMKQLIDYSSNSYKIIYNPITKIYETQQVVFDDKKYKWTELKEKTKTPGKTFVLDSLGAFSDISNNTTIAKDTIVTVEPLDPIKYPSFVPPQIINPSTESTPKKQIHENEQTNNPSYLKKIFLDPD